MLSEPIQVTLKVVTAFERLSIPYFIGGLLASTIHGAVRNEQIPNPIISGGRGRNVLDPN
jgi:hypothetical protein